MTKRVLDLFLSLFLLLLFMPVFLIVTLVLWFTMGLPLLYRQLRPGLLGELFYLYKFRTMTNETDENGFLLNDEQRLTKLGAFLRRYSLDEIPQLFNILKGDLSFVGPRPLLMEYLGRYNERQARRHEVKPGITGWAQVNGRNAISWEKKFELDVWYIDNRSFWLDIKILWLTFLKVIKAEGISGEGTVTMTKFMGSGEENNE